MAETKPGRQLGPTGEAVRANIRSLRDRERISGAELSARLKKIGRPIPPLGIQRIEAGSRRVDTDDLVALAVALGVSPIRLLMPESAEVDDQVVQTGREPESARRGGNGYRERSCPAMMRRQTQQLGHHGAHGTYCECSTGAKMATISKYETSSGATRYRVRYRTPDRRQTDKRGFTTKREAEAFAATVEVSKLKGEYVAPALGKITVGELGPGWLKRQKGL